MDRFYYKGFYFLLTNLSHFLGKRYTVALSEQSFPRTCVQNKEVEFTLLELFLISGILNSSKKSAIEGSGTILQHLSDFNLKSSEWIKRRGFFRTENKTKLTENLATGICGSLLFREYGATTIQDVEPLLKSGSLNYATKSKKRPDFLCLDQNSEAFLVECKGRDGEYDTSVLTKARAQLNNVQSGTIAIKNSCGYMTCS